MLRKQTQIKSDFSLFFKLRIDENRSIHLSTNFTFQALKQMSAPWSSGFQTLQRQIFLKAEQEFHVVAVVWLFKESLSLPVQCHDISILQTNILGKNWP